MGVYSLKGMCKDCLTKVLGTTLFSDNEVELSDDICFVCNQNKSVKLLVVDSTDCQENCKSGACNPTVTNHNCKNCGKCKN